MKFSEGYEKYIVLAEANGTTDKLSTDKSRFALLYKIAENKVIEWFIENKGTDESRYLQKIKVPYTKLELKGKEEVYNEFSIPEDYFDFIDLRVEGEKGNCYNQLLRAREVKGENVSSLFIDSFSDPSFKYRETFYTIAENAVQVYKKDFEISDTKMSYYRYPNQIGLENPDNPESQFKEGEFEFDDKLTNRIILATVSLHELSSDDPKYQAFKQETIQKY